MNHLVLPITRHLQGGLLLAASMALVALPQPLGAQAASPASNAAKAYEAARPGYFSLRANEGKQRYRHNWLAVINSFMAVADSHKETSEAPRALYTAATLWRDLAKVSFLRSDEDTALSLFKRLADSYPNDSLADDALMQRAQMMGDRGDAQGAAAEIRRVLDNYPKGDMAAKADRMARALDVENLENATPSTPAAASAPGKDSQTERQPPTAPQGPPKVTDIKHWSHESYSRVAIYLSAPAEPQVGELKSQEGDQPARIYVDIKGALLSDGISAVTTVNDALLRRVRVGEHDDGRVRVVLDLKASAKHRLLVLDNPYRIVLDALGDAPENVAAGPKRLKVVLDPGHGGHDSGALGPKTKKRLQEKAIVLEIAKKTKAKLESQGVDVNLTRADDRFLSLEERTAIANGHNADVFVSIHANSHKDPSARGIETYYLDVTHDRYSQRLADRENIAKNKKNGPESANDLQLILADLATKVNTRRAAELAASVQTHTLKQAQRMHPTVRDLGAKGALFYVLLGARMPAILVEAAFISNPEESKLLSAGTYQERVAQGIADGVMEHLRGPLVTAKKD